MVFPADILDLQGDLDLNGTWTSITPYIYSERQKPQITRGRPNEASQAVASAATFQLNNRDNRFSARNPTGLYYGKLGRNTPLRLHVPEGSTYLRFEDDNTSFISTPDSVALSVTGDIEVQLDLKLSSHLPTVLCSKWNGTGNERSWAIVLNGSGTVGWIWSPNGTSASEHTASSTVTLPLGRIALKVTFAVATSTATFYTASSIAGPWTQLGAQVVRSDVGATSIFDSTSAVLVGYNSGFSESFFESGAAGGGQGLTGSVFGFKVLSGIGGTVVASPDFTTATPGNATLTDAQGNVWTLSGTAEFSNRKYRFHGEVAEWPPRSDLSGKDVFIPLAANGLLRRLGQGSNPIDSAIRRGISGLTGSFSPVAYWPCEDGSGSTQIASGIGGPALTFTGAPSLSSDSSFLCSAPLLTMGSAVFNGVVPAYIGGTDNVVRWLMTFPASPSIPDGSIICSYFTDGTVKRVSVKYRTGGSLQIQGFDASDNALFDSGSIAFAVNGQSLRMSAELSPNGSSVNWSLVTLQPGASTGSSTSGTLASASVGNVRSVRFNSFGDNYTGVALGHVTVQKTWASLFDLSSQLNAYIGETAARRFARLCQEQGVSVRVYGHPDVSVVMGPQASDTFLNLIQSCEDTDHGMIYEPRQALALGYRCYHALVNQSPLALSYSSAQLGGGGGMIIEPTDDDQLTRNDITASRASGGSSARATATDATWSATAALSTAAPPSGVGTYPDSKTVNVQSDSQLGDQAGWLVHLGTVNELRYPSIPVDLARSAVQSISSSLQDVDLGDYLQITSPPASLSPDTVKALVWGVTETLGGKIFTIVYQTQPESPYEVLVAGSGATSDMRADTDGSSLASGVTSAATSLSVATTSGFNYPLWTTAAGDFPFDIVIGGERMTVTNITGASSPQTFTVTRSVNGVVKAHLSGEAVNLFAPCYLALV